MDMLFKRRIPLHITLLSLIALLLLAVIITLALYNYKKSSDAAVEIAENLLTHVNGKVLGEIDKLFQPVLALGNRISELPDLSSKPDLVSHPATWYFIKTLESYPHIYSVYIGYADGDFYQIIQIPEGDVERCTQLGATMDTRYALRRILENVAHQKVEIWKFLDASLRTTGSKIVPEAHYDPRERPWYKQGAVVEGLVWTAPYVFTSNNSLGLTAARRFDGPISGVFGADVTLKSVSEFIARQEIGRSGLGFIFDASGTLLAHPDPKVGTREVNVNGEKMSAPARIEDLNDPAIKKLFDLFSSRNFFGPLNFEVDGIPYIARITPVPGSDIGNGYIGVLAPRGDFTGTMEKTKNENLLFALIVLGLTLPVVALIARAISQSLSQLSQESDEIRQFNLEERVEVKSIITEINNLARSIGTMKGALRTFGQYVPKGIVRQIVQYKLVPHLGGQRQPLTLLFTDIADFTSISETMEPEALMLQASEYFQQIGSVITANGGTIDKFIGDAVMAFWNAPQEDPNHVLHACTAAMAAAQASNTLNDTWRVQGKHPFFTRIGLHTGECIVGNVGSSDRMNYTAMGDNVNMASRLEGLNKYFGTQILVSQAVRDQVAEDFLFRPAGRVIPKGSAVPMSIFTLDGSMPGKNLPAPVTDAAQETARKWRVAYDLFMARRFEDAATALEPLCGTCPEDGLLRAYLDRARHYVTTTPPADWNGVETFSTK